VNTKPIAGLFGHSVICIKDALTRVPTQITYRILKKLPGRKGPGGSGTLWVPDEGGRSIAVRCIPSTLFLNLLLLRLPAYANRLEQLEGAQYSQRTGPVNAP